MKNYVSLLEFLRRINDIMNAKCSKWDQTQDKSAINITSNIFMIMSMDLNFE